MFIRGDILEATHRELIEGFHYIIFYDGHSNNDFIGGMITHSGINQNKPMSEEHFNEADENGNIYKIQYDNTYLVNAKLIKPNKWGPYKKVGTLTNEGIAFLEDTIEHLPLETFGDYYYKIKNSL